MSKQFTANEVKDAGSVEKGLHIIIDNDVYAMGSFVDEHPGGAKILKRVGGKDASKQFWKVSGAERGTPCDIRRLRRCCYWELRFVVGGLAIGDGQTLQDLDVSFRAAVLATGRVASFLVQ